MFRDNGIEYINTYLYMTEPKLCAKQMFDEWGPKLGLCKEENDKAVDEAYKALNRYNKSMMKKGTQSS